MSNPELVEGLSKFNLHKATSNVAKKLREIGAFCFIKIKFDIIKNKLCDENEYGIIIARLGWKRMKTAGILW